MGSASLFLHISSCDTLTQPTLACADTHMIHILPIIDNRAPRAPISLDILREIAWHAFSQRPRKWRQGLLAFGMVSKAWLPLLDLFFGDVRVPFTRKEDHDTADMLSVANSLSRNPTRGVLIQKYTPSAYHPGDHEAVEYFQAQITILRSATAVKDVSFGYTHKQLLEELLGALSMLREVRTLQLSTESDQHPHHDAYRLSIAEAQAFIRKWAHLEKLAISDWRTPSCERPGPSSPHTEFQSKLKELSLVSGELSGPQLLFFLGATRTSPSLQIVELRHICGLTNFDLLIFLLHVAPCLKKLVIASCDIARTPNDEYALDAAMPSLASLDSVELIGDLASDLVLLRKVRRRVHGTARTSISLALPPSKLPGVVKAMAVTSWERIDIRWDQRTGTPAWNLLSDAYNKAYRRRISFSTALESPFLTSATVMAASFTCGYSSDSILPPSLHPVDHTTAAALHAAYNLAVEKSCSPRALAVCAPALSRSVAEYEPGVMPQTLRIPSNAVAQDNVAVAICAWYRARPVNVVVDLNGANFTSYGPGDEGYDPAIVHLSGEIAAGLSASYELKEEDPWLWHRHLLFTAVVMANEMFRQLRWLTHSAIVPASVAKYESPELWSYTSGHHAEPVFIAGVCHYPGKAGWWWEDKTFGGSFEGLMYTSLDPPPYQPYKKCLSAALQGAPYTVPVRFIRKLALRSGIIPGLWGEIAQDTIDVLCEGMTRLHTLAG
ncbi:hypothetical protein DXG01_000289 [Tephrocybe rancida]|nr:hypothetical protein DXG01_000289 [Tephrocybe rancida]